MALWLRNGDVPLASDSSTRFVPWIIGTMVFLSALVLAVALVPVSTAFGIWQVTYLAMVALAAFAFSLLGERRQAVAASIASHSAR